MKKAIAIIFVMYLVTISGSVIADIYERKDVYRRTENGSQGKFGGQEERLPGEDPSDFSEYGALKEPGDASAGAGDDGSSKGNKGVRLPAVTSFRKSSSVMDPLPDVAQTPGSQPSKPIPYPNVAEVKEPGTKKTKKESQDQKSDTVITNDPGDKVSMQEKVDLQPKELHDDQKIEDRSFSSMSNISRFGHETGKSVIDNKR